MTTAPLSALIAQSLIGLTKDYERCGGVPPLPLWSDFLRVVPDAGLRRVELAPATRISRRAVAALLTGCERGGLAVVEAGTDRGHAVVKLTQEGRRAREAGRDALQTVESGWVSKFSPARRLREALATIVEQFDLELPHFPIGYGPVDDSVTGGRARLGRVGPPRIPPHGQDWIPLVRAGSSSAESLPLSALLSQALVAFAIDFEEEGGSLPTTVMWQQIPDEGVTASELPDGCPNPSGWARHGSATIDPFPPTKRSLIVLTPQATTVRDGYVDRANAIETTWRQRFGADLLLRLRQQLEDLVDDARIGHLPHFPRISWIGGLREVS